MSTVSIPGGTPAWQHCNWPRYYSYGLVTYQHPAFLSSILGYSSIYGYSTVPINGKVRERSPTRAEPRKCPPFTMIAIVSAVGLTVGTPCKTDARWSSVCDASLKRGEVHHQATSGLR